MCFLFLCSLATPDKGSDKVKKLLSSGKVRKIIFRGVVCLAFEERGK